MRQFLAALVVLLSFYGCNGQALATEVHWVNSKYHDVGPYWGVFSGIIIFLTVFQLLGLGVELWYKMSLKKFIDEQKLHEVRM